MGGRRLCIVPTCSNHNVYNADQKLSFHRFPNDPEIRRKWCLLLGVKFEDIDLEYSHRFLVCSQHFEMDLYHSTICKLLNSYESTAKEKTCSRKCAVIPKGALPTRNLPNSVVTELAEESNSDLKEQLLQSLAAASSGSQGMRPIRPVVMSGSRAAPSTLRTVPKSTSTQVLKTKPPVVVKQEPSDGGPEGIEVVNAQRNQPMQVFIPQFTDQTSSPTQPPENPAKVTRRANILRKSTPLANKQGPIVLFPPKPPVVKVLQVKPVEKPRPSVVPLPKTLLADMRGGMKSDPQAKLELVWNEDPFKINEDCNMCRMCAQSEVSLTSIFEEGDDLAKMINLCLPFQVVKNDGLSMLICLPCRRSVIRTHKFYLQCKAANARMRGLNIQNKKSVFGLAECRECLTRRPPVKAKKSVACQANFMMVAEKAPTANPVAPKRPASPAEEQQVPSTSKRTKISEYPTPKPDTPVYSIYKFPDPKNLMQLPDYDCKRCSGFYTNKNNLCKHSWLAHSKLLCTICDEEFNKRRDYEFHFVEEHDRVPPLFSHHFDDFGNKLCVFCDEEFESLHALRKHLTNGRCAVAMSKLSAEAERRKYKFVCDFCRKAYKVKHQMYSHMIIHLNIRNHKCNICHKAYHHKKGLKNHMDTHLSEPKFMCEECGAAFMSKNGLTQHSVVHSGRWNNRCTCCPLTFRFIKDAKSHFRTHSMAEKAKVEYVPFTKVTPLECPYCQRPFKWQSYYEQHLETHDPNSKHFKPGFLCDQCGQSYNQRASLRSHISKAHGTPTIYECDNCDKKYESKQGLRLHIEKHVGAKFKCRLCGQSFVGRMALQVHVRSVHTDKSFECDYCSKAFKQKYQLVTHIRVHTDERPYQCRYCYSAFKQWGDRQKHESLHFSD